MLCRALLCPACARASHSSAFVTHHAHGLLLVLVAVLCCIPTPFHPARMSTCNGPLATLKLTYTPPFSFQQTLIVRNDAQAFVYFMESNGTPAASVEIASGVKAPGTHLVGRVMERGEGGGGAALLLSRVFLCSPCGMIPLPTHPASHLRASCAVVSR